jgi:two-component system, NtrC family, response regulator HydG
MAIAQDAEEATRQLHEQDFTVVLIDMKLPRGDGGQVFRRVRQSNPQARTVVITSHRVEMDPVVQRVVAEGVDAVCYKPFDVPRLLSTLEQLTAEKGNGGAGSASPRPKECSDAGRFDPPRSRGR